MINRELSLKSWLARFGGMYILVAVFITQLVAIPALLLGAIFIQMSSEFTNDQIVKVSSTIPLLLIATSLILLSVTWQISSHARTALSLLTKNMDRQLVQTEQLRAWKEITSFSWKYALSNFLVAYLLGIIPVATYYYSTSTISLDQYFYILMGFMASIISIVILSFLLIERLLIPARDLLIPKNFDDMIKGNNGLPLAPKFIALILGIIAMMNFILAPLGYQNTFKALNSNLNPKLILYNLKLESTFASMLTIFLGLGLAYLAAQSLSDPIDNLIRTFRKIERGDLNQRAKILATDEVGELAIHFNRMVVDLENLRASIEKQLQEQLAQMKAAYEVGNVASSSLDPAELVDKVTKLITDRLGHYYAAIFLLDEAQNWAELKAATGEAGRVLKQNKHRLDLKGKSLVAESLQTQKISVLSEAGPAVSVMLNPLLPYTKAEIAIPLISGNRILGALDVHSTKENAFGILETETLQAIASHTAITLENARLYQEVQQNLRELSSLQQQYLTNAWTKLTTEQDFEYALGDVEEDNHNSLDIALSLRDQILGKIQVQSGNAWSQEEKNLVEAIAAQAAIAIENARLINESRQLASREQLAAEISNKIWTSATIDGVLQIVAKDLGRALDADKLVIELAPDEKGQNG